MDRSGSLFGSQTSSSSVIESSLESSFGSSDLRSVLNGSSGSHGQEGTDEQFVHVGCASR